MEVGVVFEACAVCLMPQEYRSDRAPSTRRVPQYLLKMMPHLPACSLGMLPLLDLLDLDHESNRDFDRSLCHEVRTL